MTGRWLTGWRGFARWGAVYLAAAVAFTWPMPARLTTHIWGDRFDAWTTLWLIDHLAHGLTGAVTEQILYPIGYNLWSFGHVAWQALAVPLVWAGVPLIAAYNLLCLGALTFSAGAAHALGAALARQGAPATPPWVAAAAGMAAAAAFTFNPYLYGELRAGCVELVAAGFLPLFLRGLLGVVARPGWRAAVAAGALLAVTGPFNWYYAVFGGMLGVAFAAWQALAGRWRAALWCAAALAVAGGLVAPLVPFVRAETPSRPPIAAEQFSPERWARSRDLGDGKLLLTDVTEQDRLDLDALQVVLNSTTVDALLEPGFPTNPLESTPGRVAWALGVLGLAAAGRRGWPWGALAVGFTVLTLGPYALPDPSPPVPAWSVEHPLPYLWLYNTVPLFSKAYRPYRIAAVVLCCLAAAAAVGVARLGGARLGRRGWGARALVGGAGLAVAVGATQPLTVAEGGGLDALADARVPASYAALAGRPGAIIEVPLHAQPVSVAAARAQYHQVLHGRPMLNCNQLIRRTELAAFQGYVTSNGLLMALSDLARRAPPWAWDGTDADALLGDGFADLVVRTALPAEREHLAGFQDSADRLGLAALRMLEDAFGPPWLDEGGLMAFALRPTAGGTWDGAAVRPLAVPYATLGLPVTLLEGQSLQLGAGDAGARRVGVWVRAEGGGAALRVRAGDDERVVPVEGDGWVWARVEVGAGLWSVALVPAAGTARLTARLARPEVEARSTGGG